MKKPGPVRRQKKNNGSKRPDPYDTHGEWRWKSTTDRVDDLIAGNVEVPRER